MVRNPGALSITHEIDMRRIAHTALALSSALLFTLAHAGSITPAMKQAKPITEQQLLTLSASSDNPVLSDAFARALQPGRAGVLVVPVEVAGVTFPGGLALAKRADGHVWALSSFSVAPLAEAKENREKLVTEFDRLTAQTAVTKVTHEKDGDYDETRMVTSWDAVGPNKVKAEVVFDQFSAETGFVYVDIQAR